MKRQTRKWSKELCCVFQSCDLFKRGTRKWSEKLKTNQKVKWGALLCFSGPRPAWKTDQKTKWGTLLCFSGPRPAWKTDQKAKWGTLLCFSGLWPAWKTDQKVKWWTLVCVSELSVLDSIHVGDKLTSVSERLIAIMKNYVSAERYFPVGKPFGCRKMNLLSSITRQCVETAQDVCHTLAVVKTFCSLSPSNPNFKGVNWSLSVTDWWHMELV